MINLKTFTAVALATAAIAGFSIHDASAQSNVGSGSGANTGAGSSSGSATMPNRSSNPNTGMSTGSPSGAPYGSTAGTSSQCEQVSDPRARQDCIERANRMNSGSGSLASPPASRDTNSGAVTRPTK